MAKHRLFFILLCCLPWARAPRALDLVCVGDCEKVTKSGLPPASPRFWDPRTRTLSLHGGRNEVVAAQMILRAPADLEQVNVTVGDLRQGEYRIPAKPCMRLYLELYQFVKHGGYTWGPRSRVLPDKRWYPEVLVPFDDPYDPGHKPLGHPFTIRTRNGGNQGIWIDIFIPRTAPPGLYAAPVTVTVGSKTVARAQLRLRVHPFTLPDRMHVDAYGEIYGKWYRLAGVAYKQDPEAWWRLARLYHQMAHYHRFVIFERSGQGPGYGDWKNYDKYYGQVLDGSLFTRKQGYVGPGAGTGVPFWRAPLAQRYDGRVPNLSMKQLSRYTEMARGFREHCRARGWSKKRFFAYIIDEAGNDPRSVKNERLLQEALDRGAGKGGIDLIWTSHTNPATLARNPLTDKRGYIRWWAPNGSACNPGFLAPLLRKGQTAWFYHSGHPAVGVHCVNATGVELRTWGVICWRYGMSGSFWWAMDFGDTKDPLGHPCYKAGDDRWGNGMLFYPGTSLPKVGLPATRGPLPCLRMKAYRRGLQDYEYCWLLASRGRRAQADAIIKAIVPVALAEAKTKGTPPWPTDVGRWYEMREELARRLGELKW